MIELETFEALTQTQSLADLHASCLRISRDIGYEFFLYALRINISLTRPYQFIFSGYPSAWRSHYDTADYARIDPSVQHCVKRSVPLIWKPPAADVGASQLFRDAADFGLASGASFPVHGDGGELGMLSLAGSNEPQHAAKNILTSLGSAQLLACYLQETVRRLVLTRQEVPLQRPVLTAREKECMLWAADGKTAWEISQILGITERTSVFHLDNAARKMGATNRRQAAVRAVSMGLINP